MRIVVVDDEDDICFILAYELKKHGFDIVTFSSALEAKLFLNSNAVEAIICDFLMPEMNGLQLFKWMKSMNINIPFFVLTGETMMDDKEILKTGITGVLHKPHDLNQLPYLLKRTLFCA